MFDPNDVFSTWQPNKTPCKWYGVTCTDQGRVTGLDLSESFLKGSVSFSSLSSLDMLTILNLSENSLFINSTSLFQLPSGLEQIILSSSGLVGSINEKSLVKFKNLVVINLSNNKLSGLLPETLVSNPDSVQVLDLSSNNIFGTIPDMISNYTNLKTLNLSFNSLTGNIPKSLGTLKSLQVLALSHNLLSGWIPEELERLILSSNKISGPFPASISLFKNLKVVDFSSNMLSGTIPSGICSKSSSLEELRIPDNLISGHIPDDLSQCWKLKSLDLSLNYLTGTIPSSIGSLANLEQFFAWYNGLEGNIPVEFGKLKNLKDLILNNNHLSGEIPLELLNCSNLEWMSLTSNSFSGEIPPEFGMLSRLAVLQLANNSFTGKIPMEFGNCSSLVWLDLNSNKLTGEIPARIGRHHGAQPLIGILSGNTIAFVRNIGNSCKGIGGLLEFAGIRPERLLQVPTLRTCDFTRMYSVLVLSHNQLSGEIPDTFGHLKNMGVFDASHNRLQGPIPESFTNLTFLVQIDLSNNELTGQIPTRGQLSTLPESQYANNTGLCGVPLPECRTISNPTADAGGDGGGSRRSSTKNWANNVIVGILILVAIVCLLVVWAIAMRVKQKVVEEQKLLERLQASRSATTWKIEKEKEPLSINVATFQRQLRKLKFSQLIEATNGFSSESLIGCGGFGEVFRAKLKDGSSVAIKKLVRLSNQGDREFMAEMETLGKINHKNLVPLLGYCKIGEERLLVYEFMEFGSLDEMLHRKPMKAGTPGYVPPEYYQSFRCTAKGDVYSLGVVFLELLSRKRPTDKDDFGDTNLVGWAKMKVREGKAREVIDPELLSNPDEQEREDVKEIARFLEITLQCVDDFPSRRPNMLQVVTLTT
ncbi:Concanavalin A-like lectin/glucanase, subgroup [Artemisia annua]|uniref:non-specific serine/threonine protein kinase n=1 Tax=Artemisia annua TaxID=35608 RepID=A0A2U1MUQ2_ARTAN|nr:Concanavalin A-like lectin/glucanase, subgroup [Artemisia annua]